MAVKLKVKFVVDNVYVLRIAWNHQNA